MGIVISGIGSDRRERPLDDHQLVVTEADCDQADCDRAPAVVA